jgi:hypothetical protein
VQCCWSISNATGLPVTANPASVTWISPSHCARSLEVLMIGAWILNVLNMARKCNQVLLAKAKGAGSTRDRAACKREKLLRSTRSGNLKICDTKTYPKRKRTPKVLDYPQTAAETSAKNARARKPKVKAVAKKPALRRTVANSRKTKTKCHKCRGPVRGRIPKTAPAPGRPRTHPWCRTCVLKAALKHKLRTVRPCDSTLSPFVQRFYVQGIVLCPFSCSCSNYPHSEFFNPNFSSSFSSQLEHLMHQSLVYLS